MLSAVDLTSQLVRLDTINPPGHESRCARLVGPLLQDFGFEVRYVALAEGRESLIATIGGTSKAPAFCFTGHLDTVPLGTADWTVDPHGGEVRGDKLYGRGTSDMKSGIGAFIAAASKLGKALRSGPGVMLLLTASEETGCQGAAQLASMPLPLQAGCLLVGEPTANVPALGHKGALWLRACVHGKTAHGSMPHLGENAIYRAADAIGALRKFDFGNTTLNVGTIAGGQNINSVPDRAEFTIDLRTVAPTRHDALAADVKKLVGKDCELTPVVDVPPLSTSAASAWARRVFALLEKEQGRRPEPKAMMYFTDGPVLQRGTGPVDSIILGPGEPTMAHQTDEYCSVSKIEEISRVYAALIEDWYAQ